MSSTGSRYDAKTRECARTDRTRGLSVREIGLKYAIAKSTASLWVRGVEVCQQGKERISGLVKANSDRLVELMRSGEASQKLYKSKRDKAFLQGLTSEMTVRDAFCVGLYAGDGTKTPIKSPSWGFTSSNSLWVSEMRQWAERWGQPGDLFKAEIHVHPEDDITAEAIQEFWHMCGIPKNGIQVRRIRSSSSKRLSNRRTPYGTCQLRPIKNGVQLYNFWLGQLSQTLADSTDVQARLQTSQG